ncbi:MAG: thiopurine S-methyltransferase [Leptospira sp.]|jgi:thiopurine S-methyltransferase|nr:MAG: thiopurine S-methyltransferase [Leptospira sp.]
MDPNFWHSRWESDQIGFHINQANPLLVEFFPTLSLKKSSRVFLPLCGKTLDIHWLLDQGFQVVGVELSKKAITQLFQELGIEPEIRTLDKLEHFSAEGIDIFVGNLFDLSKAHIGKIDAIYDRAALVALPLDMRISYTNHLTQIAENAPQLLICFEYDPSSMEGPPFSIEREEVLSHYNKYYKINQLKSISVKGGMRNGIPVQEKVWHLEKNL